MPVNLIDMKQTDKFLVKKTFSTFVNVYKCIADFSLIVSGG